jgi:hypothetical protein
MRVEKWTTRIRRRVIDLLTQRRERHGIALSMYIEAAPLDTQQLWPQLEAALDLIAHHSPSWLRRMRRMGNTVDVRRIPGTRARLIENRRTILDPYLLANFLPAQIAASIIHEAAHALMQWHGIQQVGRAREERVCRRAELRFGRALLAAGVEGAQAVIDRAAGSLAAPDNEVGVVVNWEELRITGLVTRLNDLPIPRRLKRLVARRHGVLDTPQGRDAFGD